MILISTSNLNFNNVTVGEDGTKTFTIFNDNIFSVTVTISSGISQYVVTPTSDLISANGHLVVEVKFTPTDALIYNSLITITNSYDASVDSVSLTGQGNKPVIAVSPASLSFGTIATNDSTQQNVIIQNTHALATLKITNIVSSSAAFTFFPTTFNILPLSQAQLTVVFSSVAAAVNTGTLTLINNSSNAASKQISLTGTTEIPTANFSVSSLNFGNITLNDIKTMNVTLTNYSISEILLLSQSIQFTNLFFSTIITNIRLAKNESLVIPVKFSPTNTATQNGILNLQTNAGLFTITLTGKGIISSNIYLPATTIDLGNTVIGETSSKNLTIINNGQLDLIITAITSDNVRFTANLSAAVVIAGDSIDIAIIFDPIDTTTQTGQLTIASNDPDTPNFYVNMKGQGVTPVIAVDSLLSFADTIINETKSNGLVIVNTGNCLLTITNMIFDNPTIFSSLQVFPLQIAQKSSKTVDIEFAPVDVGFNNCLLTIQSNDFNSLSKFVDLKGNGVSSLIVVTPVDIDFSYVNISIPRTQQITVFNNGAAQLIVSNITSSDPQFVLNVTSLTIDPGASEIVTLTLTASSAGNKSATIIFVNNDPPNALINARGIAESPVISVDASPIVFSTVALNEERTKTLTILNNSHVTLNISAAMNTLTPTELHISATSFSVAPGASNTLTVTFKPTTTATYTGTLELSSNDIATPLISISTSGVGTTIARILVTQTSIYFPPTAIGTASHESLEIKNIGSAPLIFSATAYSLDTFANEFFIDSTSQITIQPSQSHFYSVRLKPTTIGTKAGRVKIIVSNDPNVVDPILVTLSGSATYAVLNWSAFALDDLIPSELPEAAAALSGIMGGIIATLNFINGLLSTLKTLILDVSDPLVIVITGIRALVKDLLNDLAETGLYYLEILPTDPRINPKNYPEIFEKINWSEEIKNMLFDYDGIDVFNSIKGGSKAFFNKITLSFDDAADGRRPQFSSNATAGCIIIAMDSGDIFKMIDLLTKLTKVLQLEFKAKFNPPTNLAAIAGNNKVKLTFTGAGGLLPNAFLIFRSETAGGELIADTATLADGTKRIVYRTDKFGRLVKRYELIGVTTMVEQLMKIFDIPEAEAKNMFSAAMYNIKGLLANLDRAISMKFSYDDENLDNDKSYSYTIVSASIDDTVDTSRILMGIKYSDELYTTYGINSDDNPEMWVYDITQKVYPALLSDAAIIRDDPTDPDSIGPTYIFGAGEFSTEISVTPKSGFSANITGSNRCRNYKCRFEEEITETITFTAEDFQTSNFVRKLKNNPIISTVVIKNKSRNNEVIKKSQYSIILGNTSVNFTTKLQFNSAVSQEGEELLVTYSYFVYSKTKKVTEIKKQSISPVNENVMTVYTDNKLLVKDSLVITATKSFIDLTNQSTLNIKILNVNELDGLVVIQIEEVLTQTYTATLELNYSYYLAPNSSFRCVASEPNSYYFDIEECDNGTTLCPSFKNANCVFNSGIACTNTNLSKRVVVQVYSTDINNNTTGGVNIGAEDIPFKNFYDPIYCQNGYTAQRCDGYLEIAPRAGYKGTPPDWESKSLGDLVPGIAKLAKMIDDFLKSLLDSLQGATQAILDFITLIQMKITELINFLTRIKSYLDILAYDFKGGGFYLLNVLPHAGGNEYLKQAIQNAEKGPASDETGYTAGIVIAYGGPSSDAIAKALKTIFG